MQESEVYLALEPKMPRIVEYGQLPPVETKPTDPEYSSILDALVRKINPHFKAWEKNDGIVHITQPSSLNVHLAPSRAARTVLSSPTTSQVNSTTMWKCNP